MQHNTLPPRCLLHSLQVARMAEQPLWQLSAVEAVQQLRSGRVTPLQLVEAAEQRWKVWPGHTQQAAHLTSKATYQVLHDPPLGVWCQPAAAHVHTCSSNTPLANRAQSNVHTCTAHAGD